MGVRVIRLVFLLTPYREDPSLYPDKRHPEETPVERLSPRGGGEGVVEWGPAPSFPGPVTPLRLRLVATTAGFRGPSPPERESFQPGGVGSGSEGVTGRSPTSLEGPETHLPYPGPSVPVLRIHPRPDTVTTTTSPRVPAERCVGCWRSLTRSVTLHSACG